MPGRTLDADDGRELRREISDAMTQAREARGSIASHMAACTEHNRAVENGLEHLNTTVNRLIVVCICFAIVDLGIVKLPELIGWLSALK